MKIFKLINGKYVFEGVKGKLHKFDTLETLKIGVSHAGITPSEVDYGLDIMTEYGDNCAMYGIHGIFMFSMHTQENKTDC